MNMEEIEEIETLEIDFKDIDELEFVLEVSSKKAIYLIDDLIKHLFELQQENKKYKEAIDKAIKLLGNYKHYSTPDEKQNSDNEDLVNNAFDILKEVE